MKPGNFNKIFLFILSVILIGRAVAEDDPASQRKKALLSIQIVSSIFSKLDTTINANFRENRPEIVDSICYSHKTMLDLMMENDLPMDLKFDLGNNLKYRKHYLGLFTVSYATYYGDLLKINFDFDFTYYQEGEKIYSFNPPQSFLDSIVALSPLRIIFVQYGGDETRGFRTTIWIPKTEKYFRHGEKKLLPRVETMEEDASLQTGVDFVNDPARGLIYGFACSIGGEPPQGLEVFAEIVHFKKTYLLEKLLYSPNPVTRLNACDGLEYLEDKSNYVFSFETRKRIQDIHKEKTIINCCWGCFPENLSVHDAYLKAEDSKKFLYDNFFFPKK